MVRLRSYLMNTRTPRLDYKFELQYVECPWELRGVILTVPWLNLESTRRQGLWGHFLDARTELGRCSSSSLCGAASAPASRFLPCLSACSDSPHWLTVIWKCPQVALAVMFHHSDGNLDQATNTGIWTEIILLATCMYMWVLIFRTFWILYCIVYVFHLHPRTWSLWFKNNRVLRKHCLEK